MGCICTYSIVKHHVVVVQYIVIIVLNVMLNTIIVSTVILNSSEIKNIIRIYHLVTMRLPCVNVTVELLYVMNSNVGISRTDGSRNKERDHPPRGVNENYDLPNTILLRQSGSRSQQTSSFRPPEFIPNHVLREVARSWTIGSRIGPEKPGSRLMFDLSQPKLWGTDKSDKRIRPKVVVQALSGQWPNPHSSNPRRDEFLNQKFIRNHSLTGTFKVLEGESVRRLWGAGVPVLDHVALHSCLDDTWDDDVIDSDLLTQCTETRGMSLTYLDDVEVRELVMGESSDDEIKEVHRFVSENVKRDYKNLALAAISLDCEEVKMCSSDYERFTGQRAIEGDTFRLQTDLPPGDKWVQAPVKIMFGNGVTYAVMITAQVYVIENEQTGETEHWTSPLTIQDEMVQLLHDLPTAYGLGIKSDIMEIEKLVCTLTGKNFEMDDFVDLAAIAVGAGYNKDVHNMTVLSYELTGGLVNKHCSRGDGKWGLLWKDLPASLKTYALADLKFGFHTMIVLYALLIKNLFPDPDIVLAFTRATHREFGLWFGKFLLSTFKGVEVKASALADAAKLECPTLEDLFKSLRFRVMGDDGITRLSTGPPERVWLLFDLYGNWPSVTQGGCKFLLQARAHFVVQYELLTSSAAHAWKDLSFPVTEEMREAAVYAVPNVQQYDWTVHTKHRMGLGQHPHRRDDKTLTRRSFSTLTSADVAKIAGNFDGARRELVYEAARLGYRDVKGFVENIPKDAYFMSWVRSYYLEVQNIVFRATGFRAKRIVVPELRDQLLYQADKSISLLLDQYEAAQKLQEQRVVRIQHLQEEIERTRDDSLPLSKLTYRGQLPPLGEPNPTYKKSSRRDLENPELAAEVSSIVPAVFGEREVRYINPDEHFPLGRAPPGPHRSKSAGLGPSTLARDEVEEPSNRPTPLPDDDWEMFHVGPENEAQSPLRDHDDSRSYD
jgi:hypothetical protein